MQAFPFMMIPEVFSSRQPGEHSGDSKVCEFAGAGGCSFVGKSCSGIHGEAGREQAAHSKAIADGQTDSNTGAGQACAQEIYDELCFLRWKEAEAFFYYHTEEDILFR